MVIVTQLLVSPLAMKHLYWYKEVDFSNLFINLKFGGQIIGTFIIFIYCENSLKGCENKVSIKLMKNNIGQCTMS